MAKASKHSPAKEGARMAEKPPRPRLFEYASLPKWEMSVYWTFQIVMFILQWYWIYEASHNYFEFKPRFAGNDAKYTDLLFFGRQRKDNTDWEWENWIPWAWSFFPFVLGSSLLLAVTDLFLTERVQSFIMTAYSIAACVYVFTPRVVAVTMIQGTAMYTLTRLTRRKSLVWLSGLPLVYMVLHELHILFPMMEPFSPLIITSYKMLSYISFCLEFIDGNTKYQNSSFLEGLFQMFRFAFYLPYLCSVIILFCKRVRALSLWGDFILKNYLRLNKKQSLTRKYPQYEQQIAERRQRRFNARDTIFFFARMAFWYYFLETALHFFYFNAMMKSARTLYKIRLNHLVAIGGAVGMFFHMKYVLIWGVPAAFARLDRMQPPAPPICVSRVALYSKIWRNFDRGLYQWFKTYIFIPICQPTFSLPRKVIGLFTAYGFVLVWHGLERHNIIWIVLNIIELVIEMSAKSIYTIPSVRVWRERHIGDRMFRRILAYCMVSNYSLSLYSNFYFLGGRTAGWAFVDRVFLADTFPIPGLITHFLFFMSYVYSNLCIEVEQWLEKKELRDKEKQDKTQ